MCEACETGGRTGGLVSQNEAGDSYLAKKFGGGLLKEVSILIETRNLSKKIAKKKGKVEWGECSRQKDSMWKGPS